MISNSQKIDEIDEIDLNEQCFLKDKEHVNFNSVIINEIFHDKNSLKEGINKLFNSFGKEEDYPNWKDTMNFIDDYKVFNSKIKFVFTIYNENSNNKKLFSTLKLGNYIDSIHISIISISFSIYALEMRAFLNEKATDELNHIIYSYHKTEIRKTEYYGDYKSFICDPITIKWAEIDNLKKKIKSDLIEFALRYFSGYFLSLYDKSTGLIPSVDVFSFNFPITNKNTIDFDQINFFLSCFNFSSEYFINDDFFIYEENYRLPSYLNKNFILFINSHLLKKQHNNNLEENEAIIWFLDRRMTFYSIALNKWFKLQENIIADINNYLSTEINSLKYNNLDKILKNRNRIYKKIFIFETFKSEIVDNDAIFTDGIEGTLFSEEECFIEFIKREISLQSKKIQTQISLFKYYSDYNLKIKNIEFNKNNVTFNKFNSIIILILTVIVGILTYLQLVKPT